MGQRETEIRATIGRMVTDATLEVIPLQSAMDAYSRIPATTKVAITCSPKFGLDRTLDHVERAVRSGISVVPHLAARQVRNEAELRRFVGRLEHLGVTDLFVIGGDAETAEGDFSSAEDLLACLQRIPHRLSRIGVAAYPEGHPRVSNEELLGALRRKQKYAHYMVSQLCFDVDALISWLEDMRVEGIHLPLRVGLAAPLNSRKLIDLSMKIGVGSSLRFISKQHGVLRNLLFGTSYRPDRLLAQMGSALESPDLGIEGLHLFSFNQIEQTITWQERIASSVPGRLA